jgi:hypothetical protein
MVKITVDYVLDDGISGSITFDSESNELSMARPSGSEYQSVDKALGDYNPGDVEMFILGGFGTFIDHVRDQTLRPKKGGIHAVMTGGYEMSKEVVSQNMQISPPRSPLVRFQNEIGMDELEMDEIGMDELEMDEIGMDELEMDEIRMDSDEPQSEMGGGESWEEESAEESIAPWTREVVHQMNATAPWHNMEGIVSRVGRA